jgi:hypothetical protein
VPPRPAAAPRRARSALRLAPAWPRSLAWRVAAAPRPAPAQPAAAARGPRRRSHGRRRPRAPRAARRVAPLAPRPRRAGAAPELGAPRDAPGRARPAADRLPGARRQRARAARRGARRPVGQRPRAVGGVHPGALRRPAAPLGAARALGGARVGRGRPRVGLLGARVVGDGAARPRRLAGAVDLRARRRAGHRLGVLRRAPGARCCARRSPSAAARRGRAPTSRGSATTSCASTAPRSATTSSTPAGPTTRTASSTPPTTSRPRCGRRERVGITLGNGWYDPLPKPMFGFVEVRETLPVGGPRPSSGSRWSTRRHARGGGHRHHVARGRGAAAQEQPVPGRGLRRAPRAARLGRARLRRARWPAAVDAPPPGGRLAAQDVPPITVGRLVRPVAVREPRPGVFIVDMGENFAGRVAMRVRGPPARACGCATARRSGPTARSTCSPAPSGR